MRLSELRKTLKATERVILTQTVYVSGSEGNRGYGIVVDDDEAGLRSCPPAGCFRVVNLYVQPSTGKLIVEYDDTPGS